MRATSIGIISKNTPESIFVKVQYIVNKSACDQISDILVEFETGLETVEPALLAS